MNESYIKGTLALGAGAFTACSQFVGAVLGVPTNVMVAASLGVIAGLAWSDKDMTRRQQVKVAGGSVIAACAVAAVLNFVVHVVKGVHMEPTVLAPVALLIALFGPRWVPAVNERIGPWLDRLPIFGKKGD